MSNIISNNNIPIIRKDKNHSKEYWDILQEALDAPIITNVVNVVKNKPIEPKPIIFDSIPIKDNECIHINRTFTDEDMENIRELINNSPMGNIDDIEYERLKSMYYYGGNNE